MKRFWPWPELRRHRRAVALFVAFWVLLWLFTYATWLYDESGRPMGMHPVAILVHLAMPLVGGAAAWTWRRDAVRLRPARLLLTLVGAVAVFVLTTPLPAPIQFLLAAIFLVGGGSLLGISGFGRAALGGLLVLEASLGVLFLADALIVARAGGAGPTSPDAALAVYELLDFGVLFGVLGLLLGWLGGLLAWLLHLAWSAGLKTRAENAKPLRG